MFSRAGGEIYIAGLNTTQVPLPAVATDAKADATAVKKLKDCAALMLGRRNEGDELEVLRESLVSASPSVTFATIDKFQCFRPVTSSGRPIISRIPDQRLGGGLLTRGGGKGGVFVAAGHGAWGISQAPGTGLCCAELVEGRPVSANITALVLPP